MYIVKPNLYGMLHENMQQAKSILKKNNVPQTDENWVKLKDILVSDNKVGLIGQFTDWMINKHDSLEKILREYETLKNYPGSIPPINTFENAEQLHDFLNASKVDSELNKVIKTATSETRRNIDERIKNLIKDNIQHADQIKEFFKDTSPIYNRYSREYTLPAKYKTYSDWLYDVLFNLIKNLAGSYNLDKQLKKIKNAPGNAKIILQRPDLLIIEPLDYKMGCAVGSERMCIARSESHWNSYVSIFNVQYYAYDFTKQFVDKESMVAATINPDGSIREIQFRTNDGTADNAFRNTTDPTQLEMLKHFKPRDPKDVASEVKNRIEKFESAQLVKTGDGYEVFNIKNGSDARTIVSRLGGNQEDVFNNFFVIIDTTVTGVKQILGIKIDPNGQKYIIDADGNNVPESYLDKFK